MDIDKKELKLKCLQLAMEISTEKTPERLEETAARFFNFISYDVDFIDGVESIANQVADHCEYLYDIYKDDAPMEHIIEVVKYFYDHTRFEKLDKLIVLYNKIEQKRQ